MLTRNTPVMKPWTAIEVISSGGATSLLWSCGVGILVFRGAVVSTGEQERPVWLGEGIEMDGGSYRGRVRRNDKQSEDTRRGLFQTPMGQYKRQYQSSRMSRIEAWTSQCLKTC